MDNTLSSLVQSQFPEFVREEYPSLVRFLELYFKYLEIEKNPQNVLSNLISYTDIDRTLDEFVSKFEKTYIDGLPLAIAGDKRNFIKHVSDLYGTKGTEESFKLLFRLLFDEDIELYYPKAQMLRISDGRWEQRNSIKVKVTSGNALDTINKKVKIITSNGVINTFVKNVIVESNNVYELYIEKNFALTITPGDIVTGLNFAAVIQPTAVNVRVVSGGNGFHVGQVFDITSVRGSGSKVKITRVDADGGIKRLAFISFGNGYQTDFLATLQADQHVSGGIDAYKDYTNGFIESVQITKQTYFLSDYTNVTYSGTLLGSSYFNDYKPENVVVTTNIPATVKFTLGGLCQYRGEYTSADGFLSDVNVIQDGYMYQDFSYVIKTKQKIQDYANIVKKLIHPAGTVFFGEQQNSLDIDLGDFFDYEKVLVAQFKFTETINSSDLIQFLTGKGLSDAAIPIDDLQLYLTKVLSDIAISSETVMFNTTKSLSDSSLSVDDIFRNDIGKNITEISYVSDSLSINTVTYLQDSASSLDSIVLNNSRMLADFLATPNDSYFHIYANNYSDPTYNNADYVGIVLL